MIIEIGNVYIDTDSVEAVTASLHKPDGSYIVLKSGKMIECNLDKDEAAEILINGKTL